MTLLSIIDGAAFVNEKFRGRRFQSSGDPSRTREAVPPAPKKVTYLIMLFRFFVDKHCAGYYYNRRRHVLGL